jgi:hypothetical protein
LSQVALARRSGVTVDTVRMSQVAFVRRSGVTVDTVRN